MSKIWHNTYDEGFPAEGDKVIVTDGKYFWLDESIDNSVGFQWNDCDLWEKTEWAYPEDVYKASIQPEPQYTLESAIDYLQSIGWMQEHDRILSETQWIPYAADSAPKKEGQYLVTLRVWMENGCEAVDRITSADRWVEGDWWFFAGEDVLAWAEMPDPYEGGSKWTS